MFSLASIVLLSAANMAHAHISRIQPRIDAQECCPCSQYGNDRVDEPVTTVTVTEAVPAPEPVTIYVSHTKPATSPTAKTVTVHRTITESPLTVYVTLDDIVEPSDSSTVDRVPINSEPGPVTVTVLLDDSRITQPPGSKNVDLAGEDGIDEDGTDDGENDIGTQDDTEEDSQNEFTVLENIQPYGPAKSSAGSLTANLVLAEEDIITVSSDVFPTKSAAEGMVPVGNGSVITLTASPSAGTVSSDENIGLYQTFTQSIHNGDNIDIEITIINTDTGAKTCTIRDTGLPCIDALNSNTTFSATHNTSSHDIPILARHKRYGHRRTI